MTPSSSTTVVHHRWTDIAAEQITPAISRRFISGDRVTVARFELKRGVWCRCIRTKTNRSRS